MAAMPVSSPWCLMFTIFNSILNIAGRITSSGKMMKQQRVGKFVQGSGHDLIGGRSHILPWWEEGMGLEKIKEILSFRKEKM